MPIATWGWASTLDRSNCSRATTSRKNVSYGRTPGRRKSARRLKRAKTEAIHQADEKEISLVAVCTFVVSLKCADHFYKHWIDRLYGYGNFHYCVRANWLCSCWLSVFGYIFYALSWHSFLAFVLPFCPASGSGVSSQEKAQEIKAGSEIKALLPSVQRLSVSWLVMTKKTKEEGCLWFIWRLTLVFIVIPGITLAIVTPIAEYVEDRWGQCVNVRIAAWMNSVSMARRGGEEWPVSEECKNAVMPWE